MTTVTRGDTIPATRGFTTRYEGVRTSDEVRAIEICTRHSRKVYTVTALRVTVEHRDGYAMTRFDYAPDMARRIFATPGARFSGVTARRIHDYALAQFDTALRVGVLEDDALGVWAEAWLGGAA